MVCNDKETQGYLTMFNPRWKTSNKDWGQQWEMKEYPQNLGEEYATMNLLRFKTPLQNIRFNFYNMTSAHSYPTQAAIFKWNVSLSKALHIISKKMMNEVFN